MVKEPSHPSGRILSLHAMIEADSFYWERGVWNEDLCREIAAASAVILPQSVDRELYRLCRNLCPRVFPNYDLRFQWEGKVGDTLLFWAYAAAHPRTIVLPRVETLVGSHPHMHHAPPELPPYPFIVKAARGGEGRNLWLVASQNDLDQALDTLRQRELYRDCGFVIQEFLAGLDRDLRVVVIGDQIRSYWRRQPEGFLHNLAQGGEVELDSDPGLQEMGRAAVKKLCEQTGINLAGFDLVFPANSPEPLFLEINYTFGWTGLGGADQFNLLLRSAVDSWLSREKGATAAEASCCRSTYSSGS